MGVRGKEDKAGGCGGGGVTREEACRSVEGDATLAPSLLAIGLPASLAAGAAALVLVVVDLSQLGALTGLVVVALNSGCSFGNSIFLCEPIPDVHC